MRSPLPALIVILVLLAGCGEVLDTTYGDERPGSVDGASVLLARLDQHTRLRRASLLTPRMHDDCMLIVHLAPEPGLPSAEACTWLQEWLEAEDGRQAVLILRGDSPAPVLCRRWAAESLAEGERVGGITGEALIALAGRFERAAASADPPAWPAAVDGMLSCPLFTVRPRATTRPVTQDEGEQSALTLRCGPLIEGHDMQPLVAARLRDGTEAPWSVAIPFGDSRLVVAVNASPLLDGAMPDAQARKLAAGWLDEVIAWHDTAKPACAWLGSLRVRDGEPEAANPMAMVFTRWPIALAAWHLVALVALWLAARAWWLGRRETPHDGRTASFGAHVDALAGQLAGERHHQAAARAIARASGLPSPPKLRDADEARAWLTRNATDNPESTR